MWPFKDKPKRQPKPKDQKSGAVDAFKGVKKKIKNRRAILEEAAAPPSAKS